MDVDQLFSLTEQLKKQAQPRPDLLTPGSTGQPNNARPMTIAGRVLNANNIPAGLTMDQLIKIPAQDSPDAEGMGGMGLLPTSAAAIRGITPANKPLLRAAARRTPDLLQELHASPQEIRLYPYIPEDAKLSSGLTRPQTGEVFINPKVMKGISPETRQFGNVHIGGDLPGTVSHELQHLKTPPSALRNLDPMEARAQANRIKSVLPPEAQKDVAYLLAVDYHRGLSEALSYLKETGTKKGASEAAKVEYRRVFGETR